MIQELRFGNWVLNGFGEPVKVGGIISDGNTSGYKASTLKPIPLSPEILEKCGFIKDGDNYWKNIITHYLEFIITTDGYYPIYAQIPELSVESEQRVSLNKINHVHQLQNLYFALIGEELPVSL